VSEEPPTIYEWGAGREAFERWLNAFYDLVERDDLLSPLFGGRVGRGASSQRHHPGLPPRRAQLPA
jgi:truncated hemoglobin YjbI